MVVQAYAVCIGVTPECRQMELEMIGDGWGHADEVYHDTLELVQGALGEGFNPREVSRRKGYCHLGHLSIDEFEMSISNGFICTGIQHKFGHWPLNNPLAFI